MSLVPGTRLGPYEILSLLGAGGMGEVYRARDPRLGRDVAIKVLPVAFAADADRLVRFEHEARAAATLNHPNILAVYDVGQHDGAPYIVAELLEGVALRDQLDGSSPLPVRRAIDYAIQTARGLAAAHEKGIIHRDLKPENLFVTVDSRVKILDFGLAKLIEGDPALSGVSAVTTTPPRTQPGLVLGTAGYMSPEQARGLGADHRSDIFAFGAIVYEMLSGTRAFRGDTPMDAMTAILKDDPPPLPTVERRIPPALESIVERCLQKSPALRFKSADDLAFALEALSTQSSAIESADAATPHKWRGLKWIAALALIAVIAIAAAFWPFPRSVSRSTPELRVEITTPPAYDQVSMAISPDGEKIVFVASADGRPRLWLRSLRSGTARPIPGTDGASFPFWSPDSQSIGFFANEDLNRIDIDGGALRALARAPVGAGGSWNRDGVILFTPVPDAPIRRVAETGGVADYVPGAQPGQGGQRFPQFLPDGRHFLYFMADASARGVYVGSLDGTERQRLFDADAAAVFVPPASLLFIRAGTLFAQRFNPRQLTLEGSPLAVAEGVNVDNVGAAAVSASATGSIIYRIGSANRQRQLVWFDRTGTSLGEAHAADSATPVNPSLSPDGRVVAVNRSVGGNADIWLIDLERDTVSRFTSEPTPDIAPIWSPDGRALVYAALDTKGHGGFNLMQKLVGPAESPSTLFDDRETAVPMDWSRDGRFLLYRSIKTLDDPSFGSDIWALPMNPIGQPLPVAQGRFDERTAQFSPDRQWVAFESNESGRYEIHLQQFPKRAKTIVISTAGGLQPRWSADGEELFYIAPDGRLMAVALRFSNGGTVVEPAKPVALFVARVGNTVTGGSGVEYNVSADGQRFLMNTLKEQVAPPITLILNWSGTPRQ